MPGSCLTGWCIPAYVSPLAIRGDHKGSPYGFCIGNNASDTDNSIVNTTVQAVKTVTLQEEDCINAQMICDVDLIILVYF
jgi:hypothetical protein